MPSSKQGEQGCAAKQRCLPAGNQAATLLEGAWVYYITGAQEVCTWQAG